MRFLTCSCSGSRGQAPLFAFVDFQVLMWLTWMLAGSVFCLVAWFVGVNRCESHL